MRKAGKRTMLVGMVAVAAMVSGCTGLEIGGKAWVSRIDERQESQHTYRNNAAPLKCYFVNCEPQGAQEVQGS